MSGGKAGQRSAGAVIGHWLGASKPNWLVDHSPGHALGQCQPVRSHSALGKPGGGGGRWGCDAGPRVCAGCLIERSSLFGLVATGPSLGGSKIGREGVRLAFHGGRRLEGRVIGGWNGGRVRKKAKRPGVCVTGRRHSARGSGFRQEKTFSNSIGSQGDWQVKVGKGWPWRNSTGQARGVWVRRKFALAWIAFRSERRGRIAPAVGEHDLEDFAGQRPFPMRCFVAEAEPLQPLWGVPPRHRKRRVAQGDAPVPAV